MRKRQRIGRFFFFRRRLRGMEGVYGDFKKESVGYYW